MATITIQTTLNNAAEAHVMGQGITTALEGASVVGTPAMPGNVRVQIEVSASDLDYVISTLDNDDRVIAYRVVES